MSYDQKRPEHKSMKRTVDINESPMSINFDSTCFNGSQIKHMKKLKKVVLLRLNTLFSFTINILGF